jgi:hypothetical protein
MKLLFAICQGGGNGDVREGRWNTGYSRGKDRGTGCFNGPTPRGILWLKALRGMFEIAHLAGSVAARPEGKGIRKNIKESVG